VLNARAINIFGSAFTLQVHNYIILQLELFLRRRIGRHFSQLSIMISLMKFQFIFKDCNMLLLLHC